MGWRFCDRNVVNVFDCRSAFTVAAPHFCNMLPADVVVANSLSTFRWLLKRFYPSSHVLTSSTDIIQLVVLAMVTPLRPLYKITDWLIYWLTLQTLRQTDGAMWSLSELTQAVVIVTHVHALSIFLAGCKLYSADAVLALFGSSSSSEPSTDKLSLRICPTSDLSNTLVSLYIIIFYYTFSWLCLTFLELWIFCVEYAINSGLLPSVLWCCWFDNSNCSRIKRLNDAQIPIASCWETDQIWSNSGYVVLLIQKSSSGNAVSLLH